MRTERQVLFWLFAAVALILLIGLLKEILLPFVTGLVLAYCLNPLADLMEEKVGIPRLPAAAIIVAALMVLFGVILVFVVPTVLSQAQALALALPGELDRMKVLLTSWAQSKLGDSYPQAQSAIDDGFGSFTKNWDGMAAWVAQSLWTQGKALFNFITLMLVTPLVVFYLLVDWKAMLSEVDSWLPRDHAVPIRRLAGEVNSSVGAFIRGQGMVCLILALFYALALSAVGLNYGLLVGLMTGIGAFVPFVGWALGLITASVLAVIQFWPDSVRIAMVVGVFLAGQALDAGFLSPKIVGERIGLHPVWLIFSLIAFSYLFGIVGVLVAVPLAAALGVLVRFGLKVYLDSPVYAGKTGEEAGVADKPDPSS